MYTIRVAEVSMECAIIVHQPFGFDVNERRRNIASGDYLSLTSSLPTCASAVERLNKTADRLERLKQPREKCPMPLTVSAIGSMHPSAGESGTHHEVTCSFTCITKERT